MRHLHELSADEILAQLETRQDAYVVAAEAEARAEAAHRAMEGAVYKALRSAGESVKDAEMGVRSNESVLDSLNDLIKLQSVTMRTRSAVDRAKLASDLYRTVQANTRRV